jgi:hypothetical protein
MSSVPTAAQDWTLARPLAMVNAGPYDDRVTEQIETAERAGQPITLVCFDASVHSHTVTRADILHVPCWSLGVAKSCVQLLLRQPASVARSVARLVAGAVRNRGTRSALLLRIPSVFHAAYTLRQRGVSRVEAAVSRDRTLASVLATLTAGASRDLADLPVDWARLTDDPRIAVRWSARQINSITAEVSLEAGARRVVVKRQRSHHGEAADVRWAHELRTLHLLRERMGDGPLTVPAVLLEDRSHSTVVMERAQGMSLHALFVDAAANRSLLPALLDAVRAAGAWVAAMQRVTRSSQSGEAVLDALAATAREDLRKLAFADRMLRRHERTIATRIEELAAGLRVRTLEVAGHHDDYWPGNIFVGGERVTVIDFESYREGLLLEDPAFFLLRCEMLRARFRLPLPDLANRFFAGYGAGGSIDAELLRLCTISRALRMLARGAGEDLPWVQRRWTRSTIGRMAVQAALG